MAIASKDARQQADTRLAGRPMSRPHGMHLTR